MGLKPSRTTSLARTLIYPAAMSSNKDFRVAIVGGGLCGLACAVYLLRAGIHVDAFESAVRPHSLAYSYILCSDLQSRFKEVGAGVDLGSFYGGIFWYDLNLDGQVPMHFVP